MTTPEEKNRAKQAAAKTAVALVEEDMLIGLGTGTTAAYFIEALIERCRSTNMKIAAVATSEHSAKQAQAGGIPLYPIDKLTALDLTFDGADEIDPQKRMIKGGGGALLREKIIATLSREMIVLVDKDKLVDQLGAFPLPVEVIPFAHEAILNRIGQMGYQGTFRYKEDGQLYATDNGNYIIDIVFKSGCQFPEKDQETLRSIPGVVETGFFFNLAGRVIIGDSDGKVKIWK